MSRDKPEKEYTQEEKEAGIRVVEQYHQERDRELKKVAKTLRKEKVEKGIITSLAFLGGMGIIFVVVYVLFHLHVPLGIILVVLLILTFLLFGWVFALISKHLFGEDIF